MTTANERELNPLANTPQSGESVRRPERHTIKPDNAYKDVIAELQEAPRHYNQKQLNHFMPPYIQTELLGRIEADTKEMKYVLRSQSEHDPALVSERPISFDEIILEHIDIAIVESDPKSDLYRKDWYTGLTRQNGLRDAVAVLLENPKLRDPFISAVRTKQAELILARDGVESESHMNPEQLQKAAQDLGEEATESAEVTLGVDAASRMLNIDQREVQSDPYDYLRTQLPPVTRPPVAQSNTQGQSRGFGHYEPETEEDKQRKYYDKFVTAENRQDALGTLAETIKATPEISAILSRYDLSPSSIDAVDAIRENPDVRFEVAKVLTKKLDMLAADPYSDMGWRVKDNRADNLKVDPVTGRRMMSRTYAVNMALKMIGGEFSTRHEGSDPIERDKSGNVGTGQHRHAATTTLMTYR